MTAVAAALRLLFLGHQWLWRDEAFTSVVVRQPLAQMLSAVRADSAPPLGYLLDRVGAAVWAGPAGLRLTSALAGTALVPLCAALGKRIAGERGGLATALLCAVAPALLISARDARMYALAGTLVVLSTLLLWRAVERPTPVGFLLFGVATAAAAYTDYFTLLAPVAQLLAVLLVLRPRFRVTAAAAAVAAVGCLTLAPWLLAAGSQLAHAGEPFWVPASTPGTVGGEAVQILTGQPLDPWVPGVVALTVLQGLAVAAGVFMIAALIVRRGALRRQGRRAALFLTVCGGGAVLLLLLISLWRPLFDGRYASAVWDPLFPVLGAGLACAAQRRLLSAALLGATAAAALALAIVQTHPDTPAAAAMLESSSGASDLVDAYPSEYELLLYYGDAPLLSRTSVLQQQVAWYWGTAAYPPGAVIGAAPPDVIANNGTIWYVAEPDDPGPVLLPAGYAAHSRRCWLGVCVTAYSR